MSHLEKLAKLVRYYILISTTKSGSGHPTTSLSAADLMVSLFFGGFFRYDLHNPEYENNDRVIFSKGHASPLFYSLWTAAGAITEKELMTMRSFKSRLEGHPTMLFPYTEVPTGSLGQGLSVGVGMALSAKLRKQNYKTFVLLGDSEVAEGSVWEAVQIGAYYKLDNLIGILDVNRLGQRGETMYGHNLDAYERKFAAFDWNTIIIDGHNYEEIATAYKEALLVKDRPTIIVAKTLKGKGVSFIENKENWHGKPLSQVELDQALLDFGKIDRSIRGTIAKPERIQNLEFRIKNKKRFELTHYDRTKLVATRKAYGNALANLVKADSRIVVLDAETSNSTYSEFVKKETPERFFEMYIAEQNMAGTALGFARQGNIPFSSTFAAFLSRAFDQIRMAGLSQQHLVFVGSHAGVSIGEDGSSQMGLEDIAMFRTVWGSTVLYPSDAISTEKLVQKAAEAKGIVYIRTTRKETAILYNSSEDFPIGGCKVHKLNIENGKWKIVIVGAGVTLHESLVAQEKLVKENIEIVVIDAYSIKPIDRKTLLAECKDAKGIVVVEDHYSEGGLADAVREALTVLRTPVYSLAVRHMPRSGKPQELLDYEEISVDAIIKKVKSLK